MPFLSGTNMLFNLGLVAMVGYAVFAAAIFFVQPRLIYYPEFGRSITGTPDDLGLAYEVVEITTADGEILHGWFVPAPATPTATPAATVLFLHGNAGSISHRLDLQYIYFRLSRFWRK